MVGIRIGDELESQLAKYAAAFQRPKSSLIREAIESKIEEWEDIQMILASYHDHGPRWSLEQVIDLYNVRVDGMEN